MGQILTFPTPEVDRLDATDAVDEYTTFQRGV